jgi:hypothetical protein
LDQHATEVVYRAIEALIVELRPLNPALSNILDHRMHAVAWTSSEELYQELHCVLSDALAGSAIPAELLSRVDAIAKVIGVYLAGLS